MTIENLHHRLLHAVTEYDRKQEKRKGYNHYALAQYIGRLQEIEKDIAAGMSVREALVSGFNGRLLDILLKAAGEDSFNDSDHQGISYSPSVKEEQMTVKTPLEIVLESFSLADAAREALGESPIEGMDNTSAIYTLKQELMYAEHQASQGPEKSRHVFANKADKIKDEIKKYQAFESVCEAHGDKRDFPKIDIYVSGKYVASTSWSKTCAEAKEKYLEKHKNTDAAEVKCSFAEPKKKVNETIDFTTYFKKL